MRSGKVYPNASGIHSVKSSLPVLAFAGSHFSIVKVPRFRISALSWRDAALTLVPFVLLLILVLWVTLHFVNPAPPTTIVMTSGADGSMFQVHAGRYAKILAKQGVTLKILPSQGSLENLKRLSDPGFTVDVGFVQGGISSLGDANNLMSLGSVVSIEALTDDTKLVVRFAAVGVKTLRAKFARLEPA